MEKKFLLLLMEGSVLPEAIDDYIERWHTGDYTEPLHAFLGMTQDEYRKWVLDPSSLPGIAESRKRCQSGSDSP